MSRRADGPSILPSTIALAFVLLTGTTALWIRTDGARAFTADAARRLAVERMPRTLPSVQLEGADRTLMTLDAFRGRTVIVDFMYTSCATLCVTLGSTFARLQALIDTAGRDDVHLLSVSFDLERDTPGALAAYGQRHGAKARRWTIARVADPRGLPRVLSAFGVVALADRYGGFTHNAALHVIDAQGRLVRILDAEDIAGVMSVFGARVVR